MRDDAGPQRPGPDPTAPPAATDGELAARAASCRDAFAALMERHFSMCHAVALARLGDPEAADEVAQETFLRAYLHLGDLRDFDRVGPWLASIARNLAENRRARGAARNRLAAMVPLDAAVAPDDAGAGPGTGTGSWAAAAAARASGAPSARDALAARQEAELVRAAVARLPEASREVVTLHFMEGWTASEIARRLGLYPSSVGRRLDKALARLRAELGERLGRDTAAAVVRPSPDSKRRAAAAIAAVAALAPEARAALLAESTATGGAATLAPAGAGAGTIAYAGHILFGGGRTMMTLKAFGTAALAAAAGWGALADGPTAGVSQRTTAGITGVVAGAGPPQAVRATTVIADAGTPAARNVGSPPDAAPTKPAPAVPADPAPPAATAAPAPAATVRPVRRPSRTTSTVAIVAVTPDPAEDAVRQRVLRVRSDMRSMATGLETYYVDNNSYPIATVERSVRKPGPGESAVPSFTGPSPGSMTTPISYLTSYFEDAFGRDDQTFAYWAPTDATGQANGWIVFSPGPDGKFDLDWTKYDPKLPQPSANIISYAYDPTNGTWSRGDIIRVKQ